ncbi:amidase family protein, partial [Variovorax paradoxus]|uniref:amidase family protein n=1 Tax=Variovorax paradoxus TaxID=34073 RepID=UPI00247AC6A0
MRWTVIEHAGRPVAAGPSALLAAPGGTIGRSPDNHLVLPDEQRQISRLQATVRYDDEGRAVLRNMSAVLPISVNGQTLRHDQESPIAEGDRVIIGSYVLEAAPANADALLVRRLERAGAVLVGALNMDEYAYGFTTENSHEGPTRNPHDLSCIAGGSSGGSGAAVAAGQVALTLGSDTNGSIRVPASLCGVFGLKPTFGRLPRSGSYPFVSSLDHLGPFARSARDLALAYDAMQGPEDPAGRRDPGCTQRAVEPVAPLLVRGTQGLRIGVLGGYFRANAGAARIVLGTRMAVFASMPGLALIVVDEEHDPSYKQQEGAR